MAQRRGERIVCGALAAGGLAMAAGALGYHLFDKGGRIGPGFMPFCAGLALACFAVWALAESLVRGTRVETAGAPSGAAETSAGTDPAGERPAGEPAAGEQAADERPADERPSARSSERRVMLVFALTVAAFALSYVTGFLLAFGLLVCALLWFVEREKPWLAIGIGAVATLGSWAVFVLVLQVPLPGGMLGLLGGA